MGHERVGILPRRKPWDQIVADIDHALGGSAIDTAKLASDILRLVRSRYNSFYHDRGVQAAFAYLLSLTTSKLPHQGGLASVDPHLQENLSPLKITANLAKWVRAHIDNPEYSEMACRAAADTIAWWSRENSQQKLLFDNTISSMYIWTTDARGFCTISRSFFANLTDRYLRYFIERIASARATSIVNRQKLKDSISKHLESISHHAFETSKITQSFSAGWFNNNARQQRPGDDQIRGFLRVAFGKLQEELLREEIRK
jgi:hypothetical protein